MLSVTTRASDTCTVAALTEKSTRLLTLRHCAARSREICALANCSDSTTNGESNRNARTLSVIPTVAGARTCKLLSELTGVWRVLAVAAVLGLALEATLGLALAATLALVPETRLRLALAVALEQGPRQGPLAVSVFTSTLAFVLPPELDKPAAVSATPPMPTLAPDAPLMPTSLLATAAAAAPPSESTLGAAAKA